MLKYLAILALACVVVAEDLKAQNDLKAAASNGLGYAGGFGYPGFSRNGFERSWGNRAGMERLTSPYQAYSHEMPYSSFAGHAYMPYNQMPIGHTPYAHMPYEHVPYSPMSYEHVPYSHIPYEHMPYSHIPYEHMPYSHIPYEHMPYNRMPYEHMPYSRMPYEYNMAHNQSPFSQIARSTLAPSIAPLIAK